MSRRGGGRTRPADPPRPPALDSGTAEPLGPQRTCVGCRVTAAQADLLRVALVDGVLTPDPRRQLPGRGASVHPDLRCVDLADKRRAFPRALRLTGPLDATLVRTHVADLTTDQSGSPR